jgi:hypothetical protein
MKGRSAGPKQRSQAGCQSYDRPHVNLTRMRAKFRSVLSSRRRCGCGRSFKHAWLNRLTGVLGQTSRAVDIARSRSRTLSMAEPIDRLWKGCSRSGWGLSPRLGGEIVVEKQERGGVNGRPARSRIFDFATQRGAPQWRLNKAATSGFRQPQCSCWISTEQAVCQQHQRS